MLVPILIIYLNYESYKNYVQKYEYLEKKMRVVRFTKNPIYYIIF